MASGRKVLPLARKTPNGPATKIEKSSNHPNLPRMDAVEGFLAAAAQHDDWAGGLLGDLASETAEQFLMRADPLDAQNDQSTVVGPSGDFHHRVIALDNFPFARATHVVASHSIEIPLDSF